MVFEIVTGMQHRHDNKAFARQRGDQVVQRQWRADIAMGQHQQRVMADGDLGIFAGIDVVDANAAVHFVISRRVKSDGVHRLAVHRVQKAEAMKAHAPLVEWLGVHQHRATSHYEKHDSA